SKGFSGLTNKSWTATAPEPITLSGAGNFSRQWQITEPVADNLKFIEVRVTWSAIGVNKQVNIASYVAK
ncbi:MAG: hypothetical protein Q8M92_10055, partial [Candidatus Subteraquimicrobiales bacterium]|nr:hypothetical protein [Candidatus Subteraquimicrobiales bacterium]